MSVIKKFRITKIKNVKPLISLKKISLSFKKNHIILDNISFNISKGQVIGLLGPNGAGKSSLMNLITGQSNQISVKFILITRTFQITQFMKELKSLKFLWYRKMEDIFLT